MDILLANLLRGIAGVLDAILYFYSLILLVYVLSSWVQANPYAPFMRFLRNATEPVLMPIRRRMPRVGMFDLSPLVVFLGIAFLQAFLVRSLYDIAARLAF